jgi:hypothetical protein
MRSRYSSRFARLVLGTLPWLVAADALASPAPRAVPGLGPPRHESGERRVHEDRWHIDCRRLRATGSCAAVLTSRSSGAGVALVSAVGLAGSITLDGMALTPVSSEGDAREPLLRIEIPEGEHELRLERVHRPSQETSREWTWPACETRHVVLHHGAVKASRSFLIDLAEPASRADDYAIELEVLGDPALTFEPVSYPGDAPWTSSGASHHLRAAPAPGALQDESRLVSFDDPGETLHHGGPMLGIGGTLNHGGSFRMRLEYEVALAEWILPGLSLDADVARGWVLAPRIEIASPVILIIPSASIGVGMPIRLEPDPDIGIRFLVGVSLGPVGASASFDLYPSAHGTVFEPVVMLRISI